MTETRDGVYTTRTGNNGEKLIQIRSDSARDHIRYVDEETKVIRLVPVP